jgi:hypothetical protein
MMRSVHFMSILLVTLGSVSVADDCLYDQDAHREVYAKLQQRYAGTIYLEAEKALEIPKGPDRVVLWRGGCEHLGFSIKYYGARMPETITQNQLFARAVELVREFDQELADSGELVRLLEKKEFQQLRPDFYLVRYPRMSEFTIAYDVDKRGRYVDVSYYQ